MLVVDQSVVSSRTLQSVTGAVTDSGETRRRDALGDATLALAIAASSAVDMSVVTTTCLPPC